MQHGTLNTHTAIDEDSSKSLDKYKTNMGRENSVGIATAYRLDGLGIEFRWGRDFL